MNKYFLLIFILPIYILIADKKKETINLNNLEFKSNNCNLQAHTKCNYSFLNDEITIESALEEMKFVKEIYVDSFHFYQEEYLGFPYGYYKYCVKVKYCEIIDQKEKLN